MERIDSHLSARSLSVISVVIQENPAPNPISVKGLLLGLRQDSTISPIFQLFRISEQNIRDMDLKEGEDKFMFTPLALDVMQTALDEAQKLGHLRVHPADLLRNIITRKELRGPLESLGFNEVRIKKTLWALNWCRFQDEIDYKDPLFMVYFPQDRLEALKLAAIA